MRKSRLAEAEIPRSFVDAELARSAGAIKRAIGINAI
jgi:hypothetical protein